MKCRARSEEGLKGSVSTSCGPDSGAEGSSCLVSVCPRMHRQEKDACAVTRNEGRKRPRGYSLESLSHVNETETIPHLDGLRLFTESSTVTPPISSNTAEREAESVNFMGSDKRATEEASVLRRCNCLGAFLTSLRQTCSQPHIAVSPPLDLRSHCQKSTVYSRNMCVIWAWSRFSAKLHCFHYLLTICVVCKSSSR